MVKDFSVHELLEKIKAKVLDPKILSPVQRRACVEELMHLMPRMTIAKILGVGDRTIRRDLEKIREENAIKVSSKFAEEHIGALCQKAEKNYSAFMQLANASETSTRDRIMARVAATRVALDSSWVLQSCGYLPSAFQKGYKAPMPEPEEKKKSASNPYLHPKTVQQVESLGPMDRERIIKEIVKDIRDQDREHEESHGVSQGPPSTPGDSGNQGGDGDGI